MSNDEYQQQNYWKSHKAFVTCFKIVSNQIENLLQEEYNKMAKNPNSWIEQQEAKALKKMNDELEEWFSRTHDAVTRTTKRILLENKKDGDIL